MLGSEAHAVGRNLCNISAFRRTGLIALYGDLWLWVTAKFDFCLSGVIDPMNEWRYLTASQLQAFVSIWLTSPLISARDQPIVVANGQMNGLVRQHRRHATLHCNFSAQTSHAMIYSVDDTMSKWLLFSLAAPWFHSLLGLFYVSSCSQCILCICV